MTYAESIGQHGLYLLASLLVLFLATGSWPSSIAAPTSQPRSCNVSGTIYSSGKIFNLPGQFPCFKYRCNNGSVGLYEAGCEYNGTCSPVNSTFDVGCATYGCTTTRTDDGYTVYQIVIKNAQCQSEGVCHPVGSTFDKGCTTYGCTTGTQDGQTVCKSVINKTLWCYVDGLEYEGFGPAFTRRGQSHCLKYRCMKANTLYLLEEGCEYKGVCHPVDSTFDDACSTYACRKSSHDGNTIYSSVKIHKHCLRGGVCHQAGTIFRDNCTMYRCIDGYVNGNITSEAIEISPGCMHGGFCRQVGFTYQENCSTYTCTRSTGQGDVIFEEFTSIIYGCRDYYGVCHDSGSQISKSWVPGVVHHNCTCTVYPTVGVTYVCST